MRYFYRVLRKSKTSKFSFRRTFKFFAVSIRSRKSRQNNAFHSCPEAADVAFPWSEVIITHISLDVFFPYQKKCQVSWLYQTHWTDWTALTFELEKRNQVSPLEQKHPCFFLCFFTSNFTYVYNCYWWWSFLLFNLHPSFTPYFANHNGSLVQPPTG